MIGLDDVDDDFDLDRVCVCVCVWVRVRVRALVCAPPRLEVRKEDVMEVGTEMEESLAIVFPFVFEFPFVVPTSILVIVFP